MDKPYTLHHGKMEEVLLNYSDNFFDSCVTDPPYALSFMNKDWDKEMPTIGQWKQVFRVLKPGAFLLSFGGSRTHHRIWCAIEDAGFEIRDTIMWVFASGFPKSLNLDGEWKGWGTALKPAFEPICVARKPLIGTVAKNVLQYRTGAINIDGCRIEGEPWTFGTQTDIRNEGYGSKRPSDGDVYAKNVQGGHNGRWPANIIHDGSEEVLALFPESDGQQGDVKGTEPSSTGNENTVCFRKFARVAANPKRGDSGSAGRFFYCAKTSRADREEGLKEIPLKLFGMSSAAAAAAAAGQEYDNKDGGVNKTSWLRNNHPTVKPTTLMKYLVKLVTRKGGKVLDPFMGSGSTGKACMFEHMEFVGIDKTESYLPIADARIQFAIRNRDNQLFLFI